MSDDTLAFIPTRSSKLKNTMREKFEAIVYNSYKKKSKPEVKGPSTESTNKKNSTDKYFNIKQAKHEVVKFGITGFDLQKKEEAKVQLAIRLGAKPPKNKYKNYKQLLEQRKQVKESTKAQMEFQQLGKNQVGKSTAKGKTFDRKRRNQKGGLLDAYGTVKVPSKANRK